MPKNRSESFDFDFELLKRRLGEIEDYVAEIEEHLMLLEIAASVKPQKARFLLKLFRQNVDSFLSEIGANATNSKRLIPNLEGRKDD